MRFARRLIGAVLVSCFCLDALATTVAELQAASRLQVRTWLTPADDIVPGQQVRLTLEIATDRWFAGGTRLEIPEVPGLVILQTDNFAANASESRQGQSWVIQRWTLEVYPQRDANFSLPPIIASVSINNDGETVQGQLSGPALEFSARRPEALQRAEHWVAAPVYKVEQSFDRALEGLTIGDAIEREIKFSAEAVMAMMLPGFSEQPIEGLRAYPEPPNLQNRSNRGTTVASRSQRITYIVEAEGEYQLPASDYYWWDTRSGELQLLSLPSVKILAGAGVEASEDEKAGAGPQPILIIAALIILAGLGLLGWLVRKLPLARYARQAVDLWRQGKAKIDKLRQPALPEKLNPGNSAGD